MKDILEKAIIEGQKAAMAKTFFFLLFLGDLRNEIPML